jgi:phosphoribosylaminoimidazole-succinocarboxamide synthase
MSNLTITGLRPSKMGGKKKVSSLHRSPAAGQGLKVTGNIISAYDVAIGEIKGKGRQNDKISNYWKRNLVDIIDNDIISIDDEKIAATFGHDGVSRDLKGRISLIRLAHVLPVEAIMRGAIAGSAWEEYQKHHGIGCCFQGHWFPAGMQESQILPVPIFTPTTKESVGHDKPIHFSEMVRILSAWLKKEKISGYTGLSLAQIVRSTSFALYSTAYNIAIKKGIIIADTKFEFGMVYSRQKGWELILIDEVLTPDSSRFWPLENYEPGRSQPSLDKQFFRDWLVKEAKWDKVSSPPKIPAHVKEETRRRYQKISKILTS